MGVYIENRKGAAGERDFQALFVRDRAGCLTWKSKIKIGCCLGAS